MKHFFAAFCLLWAFFLSAADYDCAFIGTSPIPFFEAIYQASLGHKVLILEAAPECGGAWKSISVCGMAHADLGCHQIGHSKELADFYASYAGCRIVSLDNPLESFESRSQHGFYFSQGCFELIDHLQQLARYLAVDLLLNHQVEEVSFKDQRIVLQTNKGSFTSKKLYITHNSSFSFMQHPAVATRSKYYHLYLLIADPTPPRFCYRHGGPKICRMVNLTHFVGLTNSGRQLIVLQTYNDQDWGRPQFFIDSLKKDQCIDSAAVLLASESRIYEQGSSQLHFEGLSNEERALIEIIDTSHIANTSRHIQRWMKALRPYEEVIQRELP